MIHPEEIRRRAESLYREFVMAWLAGDGDSFFPREVRCRKKPASNDLAETSRAVRVLRAGSKEATGFGYSVQWRVVRSRTFGRNEFPERVLFLSADDLLRFVARSDEFAMLVAAATKVRSRVPVLDQWMRANPESLLAVAAEVDGLLDVVVWLTQHPRPEIFARELPLAVDTKFIERHEVILRKWLDIALPPHTIRSDEEHFHRRFGLRYAEPRLMLKLLDVKLRAAAGFPCDELSLPLRILEQLTCPVSMVFIVENKVNLLTLPPIEGAIALGGLGNGVSLLRYVGWLQSVPITYWGDIDVEGLTILSMLRACFPHTQSFLMDQATIDRYQRLLVPGTGRMLDVPTYLNAAERELFLACHDQNLRLEQERIPQADVVAELSRGCQVRSTSMNAQSSVRDRPIVRSNWTIET
ncbi:MAG: hypothetical protein K2Y37_25665 [Pirellulales bacterium]|nr:hypothetical protein [Pirellulales bacterium]